jgi:hypothetical protein
VTAARDRLHRLPVFLRAPRAAGLWLIGVLITLASAVAFGPLRGHGETADIGGPASCVSWRDPDPTTEGP